ncbi:MAG: alternative ribosome rescue aminoacyl-tRNA hydrolase ArfB [Pseudomonadota bacterium]
MIQITGSVAISESEIHEEFVRSSGPGGQNVNKVATTVQLRFDVARSPSLTEDVRRRLFVLAGNRITMDGILIIRAGRFRTQEENRQDARARLVGLLRVAAHPPKVRRKTRPTAASKKRRLEAKLHRAETKKERRPISEE